MKAEVKAGRVWFDEVDPHALAQLPCAKKARNGDVTVPATLAMMGVLATELPRLHLEPGALHLRLLRAERERKLKLLQQGVLPAYPTTKTTPWKHQALAYWSAVTMGSYGLFMAMGTGKSKVAVDLVETQELVRTLVVCPKAVIPVWEAQFRQHGDGNTHVLLLDKGTVKQRRDQAVQALNQHTSGRLVIVVNYDSVWRDTWAGLWERAKLDCIIADEAHKLKGVSSKCSVYLAKLGSTIPHRYALTGTPMPESPIDVYGIARFIDPTVFGLSHARFVTRYANVSTFGMVRRFRSLKDPAAFAERMRDVGILIDNTVLTLPPLHHIPAPVDLPEAAMEKYKQMEEEAIVVVGNDEISAPHKITQMLRLQQMAGGYITRADGAVKQLHTAKLDALTEILDGLPASERVVVFGYFKEELKAVQALMLQRKRKVGRISGEGSDYVPWREGKLQDLVVQIKSGSAGIDLSDACYAIYYSTGFSLADYEQSLARLHRPGQTKTTTMLHLIARGTIDRYVYKALRTKNDVVQMCLQGLRDA